MLHGFDKGPNDHLQPRAMSAKTCKAIFLYLVCVLGWVYNPTFAQSLSGNYTIGNANGTEDYPTISAAIADLKAGTIIGDVEFNIGNGTYNETMDLSSINNGTFKITFSGASKEFTIIHPLGNIATDKSGISIVNTSHVTLKNFTLVMDDISSSRVFYDLNQTRGIHLSGASDITLQNLKLSNAKHVFSQSQREYIASAISLMDVEDVSIASCNLSGSGFLIYLDDFKKVSITDSDFKEAQTHIYHSRTVQNDAERLSIIGNTFTGPFPTGRSAAAISLFGRGGFASSYSSNLVIKNNVINTKVAGSGAGIMGIYAQGQVDAEVSNNKIYDGSFGIRFDGSFSSVLASNQVYGPSNYGLYLQLGGQLNVVNNIFTSSRQTAFISAPADIRLVHNTFYASGTQPALRIFREGGDSLVVVNNLFHVENTVGSEVTITDVTASDIRIDHNLYSGNAHTYTFTAYRLGATIGVGNSGLQYYASSLNDWKANQASYDQNSKSFNPSFVGNNDYHIASGTDYRFGTFLEDLTSDIDGDPRSSAGVDVGADQYCQTYNENVNINACGSYTFDDKKLTSSGNYQATLKSIAGCDSLITLQLTINQPTAGNKEVKTCSSYQWEGQIYQASGSYQKVLTNSVGCDSTATLNLTILPTTQGSKEVKVCKSYDWEGTTYSATGVYQKVLTNSVGCDSTATLNLTILQPTSGVLQTSACKSYDWQGTTYTSSGTYQKILKNSVGCDSTATLNLTIQSTTQGNKAISVCKSYKWEGTTYTTSGTYQKILSNSVGCDSTATLNLTILQPTEGAKTVDSCGKYVWEGTEYTASGSYQKILKNAVGCDSIATLNLNILKSTSSYEVVTACENFTWNNQVFTKSGVHQVTLTNAAGCDSLATIDLTIHVATSSFNELSVCENYEWGGIKYTESGIYHQALKNSAGCDSTATLNLTVMKATPGREEAIACGSYDWEGTIYDKTGVYEMLLKNSNGCDSVATLDLTIGMDEVHEVTLDACGTYTFGSQLIEQSGLYQETFNNALGCDSTVLLTIGMLPEPEHGIVQEGLTLRAVDGSEGLTYQWIDCDTDEKIVWGIRRSYTPVNSGNYAVQVSNGICTIETQCFGFNREETILDVGEDAIDVSIFPNPTVDEITISVSDTRSLEVSILALDGKVLMREQTQVGTEIKYSLPKPGLYLVRIKSDAMEEGRIFKVLKE